MGGDTGEGGSGLEEVLVEVEEGGATSEGAFVDEFRQEQQLEKSKIKLATRNLNLSLSLFVSHTHTLSLSTHF